MDLKDLQDSISTELKSAGKEMREVAEKALEESKKLGTLHTETNTKLTDHGTALTNLKADLLEVQQKMTAGFATTQEAAKSLGQTVTDSDIYKAVQASAGKARHMDPVEVKSFWGGSKAIINATGLNQPLVSGDRLQGIVTPQLRRMTVRDLLPVGTTTSNMIEYARELVFTNSAGTQATEGAAKPESNITFELAQASVATIAHWIAASRQVMSDAGQLQGYIDGRLIYGLKLEEEDQLLNGTGTGGDLVGLRQLAVAYNQTTTGDTKLDVLLRSILQVSLSEFDADGFVLNPVDWYGLQLTKDLEGRYLFGDPAAIASPRVWGLPVVHTQAMPANNFLTAAFAMAAQIFDREDANVRIAEQHADFFVKNMVVVLAEERIALPIFRPAAMVKGAFPVQA